jgi:hypothetical protein
MLHRKFWKHEIVYHMQRLLMNKIVPQVQNFNEYKEKAAWLCGYLIIKGRAIHFV